MLHKTTGIVLHTTKYSENAFILKVYTRDQGLLSCIINSPKGKRTKSKALLQPMAMVDIVLSSSKGDLKRITEISSNYHYTDIPYDMAKGSILIFLNEMLYRCVREAHPDEAMYDFIHFSLQVLDLRTENSSVFHIHFLVQLSRFLGFFPQGQWKQESPLFDLQEGVFTGKTPQHVHYLESEVSKELNSFINGSYDTIHLLKINKECRKTLLEALITFYRLHISSLGEVRSHKILEEVIV